MRTLLTGFGPFGKVVNNPSARIVEFFARAGAPDHYLTTRLLPVSFARAAREIRELLQRGQFDAAVLLGVAAREESIRLERFGCFAAAERVDVDGSLPLLAGRAPSTPDRYSATVPLEPLHEALVAAGLPARLSDDAGNYVCNHTYSVALETIMESGLLTRCLFIHVPPDAESFDEPVDCPTLPLERQIEAVALILARLAGREVVSPTTLQTKDGEA